MLTLKDTRFFFATHKMFMLCFADIQGNVRALKHALGHSLVYRDNHVDLDRVKRTVPEYRRVSHFHFFLMYYF
jgi:hypothetical protein